MKVYFTVVVHGNHGIEWLFAIEKELLMSLFSRNAHNVDAGMYIRLFAGTGSARFAVAESWP